MDLQNFDDLINKIYQNFPDGNFELYSYSGTEEKFKAHYSYVPENNVFKINQMKSFDGFGNTPTKAALDLIQKLQIS